MVRERYQTKLSNLTEDVSQMGEMVQEKLSAAMEAMVQLDQERAKEIGSDDDRVDREYIEIEKACSDLLALEQPVASDLRRITASFKIITDLERIGDLLVNLTDYTRQMDDDRLVDEERIVELGQFAGEMLADSLKSYKKEDTDLAQEVAKRDNEMDQMCEKSTRLLLQHLIEWETQGVAGGQDEAERKAQQVLTELLTIRDLERVADHGVNIAARTVYMVNTSRELI